MSDKTPKVLTGQYYPRIKTSWFNFLYSPNSYNMWLLILLEWVFYSHNSMVKISYEPLHPFKSTFFSFFFFLLCYFLSASVPPIRSFMRQTQALLHKQSRKQHMEAKEQPGIGTRWASAFSSHDHRTFMKLNWNNLRLN